MPIKSENAHKYPKNWKTEIVPAVRARSGNRCEWPGCGLENHSWIVRNPDGSAEHLIGQPFDRDVYETDGGRVVKVILTTAHLDHDPTNCELGNLRHWCQMHHLRYDAKHHAETARATREARITKLQPFLAMEGIKLDAIRDSYKHISDDALEDAYSAGMRFGKWFAIYTGPNNVPPYPIPPSFDEWLTVYRDTPTHTIKPEGER